MSALTLLPTASDEAITGFTISTHSLHRVLNAVVPHRNIHPAYHPAAGGGSPHIQAEITTSPEGWSLLTLAASDNRTLAAATAGVDAGETAALNWTGLVDGNHAADLLNALRLPAVRLGTAAVAVTGTGITITLPAPKPRHKRRWATTWHLPTADGALLDWRQKIADAFLALALAGAPPATAWPAGIGVRHAAKWSALGGGEEPVILCAGPDVPLLVYADGAVGLERPLRYRENPVDSYRSATWWAMPTVVWPDTTEQA